MQFEYDGKELTLDLDDIDTRQARYIKTKTKMDLIALTEGMGNLDIDALTAIYWLALMQTDGKAPDFERLNIKPVKFAAAMLGDKIDLLGEDEADDPKEPQN